jgi:molybdopterin molybdotransferase
MLSVPDALARVLALMRPTDIESVPLAQAGGRVLARNASATRDQPPFAASAMDGYAVRAADAMRGARLRVIGEAPAGRRFDGAVGVGEAVRIFTGAPLPPGADSVLIQEDARVIGTEIEVAEAPAHGESVRPQGVDFTAGAEVVAPRRLSPEDVALLAAMNVAEVSVRRRPRVVLIPTGDELVLPGARPGPDQIVASNNYGIAAMLAARGADAEIAPIARDTRADVRAALDAAEGADLIVTLGGASVGDYDLVAEAVGALAFYKVAMRPGKPLMAGRVGASPLVGLPGNPVSAMVCGHIFLRPALDALLGLAAGPLPRLRAVLGVDLPKGGPREHYMRAQMRREGGGLVVTPFANQDSSVLSLLARADALLVRPAHSGPLAAGDAVDVLPLREVY